MQTGPVDFEIFISVMAGANLLVVAGFGWLSRRMDRLEAKLFGGGRMFDSLRDVGMQNADFAERFLRDEGIPVVGGSLRGAGGRRLHYWPSTGRALQRAVTDGHVPVQQPIRVQPVASGAVELF